MITGKAIMFQDLPSLIVYGDDGNIHYQEPVYEEKDMALQFNNIRDALGKWYPRLAEEAVRKLKQHHERKIVTVYDGKGKLLFEKKIPDDMNQATPFIEALYEAVEEGDLRDRAMDQLADICK